MSASMVSGRQRVTIKDIQKILGFKRTKAGRIHATIRQAKLRQLNITNPKGSNVHVLIPDLVEAFPGLTQEGVQANMA